MNNVYQLITKPQVDESLRRVYILTDAIKRLEPIVSFTGNERTKLVLLETLREYERIKPEVIELLSHFLRQENKRGIVHLEYYKTLRKFGEKDEQSKNN